MKIKNYSIYQAISKLEKPIADSTHVLTEISFIVLRLEIGDGIVGESYLLSFQYSPQAITGALKDHGEKIIGVPINEIGKVFQQFDHFNEYFGLEGINRWAQSAFNIAMWDAWGKILKQPIWKIFGTYHNKIPIYGSGGWLSYSLEELVDEVKGYKKRGFKTVKIKVGSPDWQVDLERLKIIRETLGNDINIMIDANQGMDVSSALQLTKALQGLNIYMFEEPVSHTNYGGFQALKTQSGISLAFGEREYNTVSLRELLVRNALDIWQPDILRIGGVEEWRSSAALAGGFNVSVLPHFYKDYDVPLLCTIPNGKGAESFDWIDTLIDFPIKIENGKATPNDRPGWGFRFKDSNLTEI